MVDVPFSKPFYQWLLKEDPTLSTRDLLNIDPTIANTVSQLEGIVRKKRRLEEDDKVSNLERELGGGLSHFTKQWRKEQAIRCCTADVCLRQSVNQLYNNNKMAKLVLFSTACTSHYNQYRI